MKWIKNKKEEEDKKETLLINPSDVSSDFEKIRLSIIAELDTINLYEQFRENTDNEDLKKVLSHIIEEEKQHVEELQELLDSVDTEQNEQSEKGKEEINRMIEDSEQEEVESTLHALGPMRPTFPSFNELAEHPGYSSGIGESKYFEDGGMYTEMRKEKEQ